MANIHVKEAGPKIGSKVASLYPMWGDGQPVLFWAQGGLVRCEDHRDTTPPDRRCVSIPWREMAHRVLMFSKMIITYADGPEEGRRWGHERQRAVKWMEDMEVVLSECRAQDGPLEGTGDHAWTPPPQMASGDRDMERQGLAGKPKKNRISLTGTDYKF